MFLLIQECRTAAHASQVISALNQSWGPKTPQGPHEVNSVNDVELKKAVSQSLLYLQFSLVCYDMVAVETSA